jgi:V8-like Glu-specific endopeptidase
MHEKKASTLIRLILLLSLIQFTACGRPQSDEEARALVSSVIIGDLDWREVNDFKGNDPVRVNANPVAVVTLASGGRCTGFMINDHVLMTNEHCVGNAQAARGLVATFLRESHRTPEEWVDVKCERFIGNNAQLDYALVGCEGGPGLRFGHVTLFDEEINGNEDIYVIQQNCDYFNQRGCSWTKKVAFGSLLRKNGSSVAHNSDTLGGSSGSPIFSRANHQVLALHHAGLGNNGMGRGIENYGVVMKDIVEDILSRYSNVELTLSAPPLRNQHTSRDKAIVLAAGDYSIENTGDQHFYELNLVRAQRIDIRINFVHRSGDLDLYLLNKQGQVVARSTGVTNSERIQGHLAAGEYLVVVVGFRGAKGDYRLSM